ncbi:MAG TPA: hypothetical protein VHE80_05655, partial [Acidimicrobiales bacterium]|nr:hypothetical protein [Acidimicrobiales bacterium]
MTVVLVVLGVLLLLTLIFDVLWTVVGSGAGAGPLTGRLSALLWRLALRFGRGPDGPRHRLLAASGVAVVVVLLLVWILVAWGSWWLIFSASRGAVRVVDTGRSAGLVERLYFAGEGLFTATSTDYATGPGGWRAAKVAITASGVIFVTLAITYLIPVASAAAERRQLGAYIQSLGRTPETILITAWTGETFGSLPQHLVTLTPMVHLSAERHLTYPVLHYFHSPSERTGAAASFVVLDEVITLLRWGVAAPARPDPAAVAALGEAVGLFLDTIRPNLNEDLDRALDPPALDVLGEAGI